jgi:hypothetical protein
MTMAINLENVLLINPFFVVISTDLSFFFIAEQLYLLDINMDI